MKIKNPFLCFSTFHDFLRVSPFPLGFRFTEVQGLLFSRTPSVAIFAWTCGWTTKQHVGVRMRLWESQAVIAAAVHCFFFIKDVLVKGVTPLPHLPSVPKKKQDLNFFLHPRQAQKNSSTRYNKFRHPKQVQK